METNSLFEDQILTANGTKVGDLKLPKEVIGQSGGLSKETAEKGSHWGQTVHPAKVAAFSG